MTLTMPEQNLLAPVLAALPADLHPLLADAVAQIAADRGATDRQALEDTQSRITWMSEILGGVAAAFHGTPGVAPMGLRDLPAVASKTRKAAFARGWDGQ